MDMYQSEKNLLEKLADAIPGLKGYREKESRRLAGPNERRPSLPARRANRG